MKKIISLLALPLLLAGCKTLNDMNQMKQSTQNMEASTKSLQTSTDEVKNSIKAMKQDVGNTYFDLRLGDAMGHRADLIQKMEAEPKLEGKIEQAGKYFMAFEFQLWKNQADDTQDKRISLFADATKEFFLRTRAYMPGDKKINVTSKDAALMNLYALAIAVDERLTSQKYNAKKLKFEEVSMLSLIRESLEKKPKVQSGEIPNVPEYINNVLTAESEAVYLLQIRYNFTYALVLDQISHINSASKPAQVWSYLFGMDVDPSTLNVSQLGFLTDLLQKAKQDRALLEKLGYPTPVDKTMEGFYRKLRLASFSDTGRNMITTHLQSNPQQLSAVQVKALTAFMKEMSEVVQN